MTITINNRDIELKYSFRAMMIYEKIQGEAFNPKGVTETIIYMYSTIIASDMNANITFDDFINWLDENPTVIEKFSKWLMSIIERNRGINKPSKEIIQEDNSKNV